MVTLSHNQKAVLKAVQKRNRQAEITLLQLSMDTGLSMRTIHRHIVVLRGESLIEANRVTTGIPYAMTMQPRGQRELENTY